jgi:hypothetical protein
MTIRWFIREIRPYSLALVPFIAAAGTFQAGVTGLSDEDRSVISQLLGEDVLGPALPADPVGETATLIPLAPSTRIFRLSSGPDAGTTETDILEASAQEGSDATWQYAVLRRWLGSDRGDRAAAYIGSAVLQERYKIRQGSAGKMGLEGCTILCTWHMALMHTSIDCGSRG